MTHTIPSDQPPHAQGADLVTHTNADAEQATPLDPGYSAQLVTEYDVAFIAIKYQKRPTNEPVQVAHVYVKLDQGGANTFYFNRLEGAFWQAYLTNLNVALDAEEGITTADILEYQPQPKSGDKLHNGKPPKHDVKTYLIGAPEISDDAPTDPEEQMAHTGTELTQCAATEQDAAQEAEPEAYVPRFFALAQIFMNTPDETRIANPLLEGYEPKKVLDLVTSISAIPVYDPHGQTQPQAFTDMLWRIQEEGHFGEPDIFNGFEPPNTGWLGGNPIKRNEDVLAFPPRPHIDAAKKKAGVKPFVPANTKVSQPG